MTTTIPIPAALLDSPLFGAHQDLQLLHETHGGLPLPLKTEAVFEVLAFRTAIKAGEPGLSSLVEKWAAAVLPQKHRSPVTSPKRTAVPLPNLSPSAPRTGERAPDPRPALGFAPIQCVPEYEPESENHSLFPAVPGGEARFVPVQLNPECDAGRNSSSRAAVSLPVSPGIAEVALPATASAPVTPPSPKKATGYFPLQGVKRSSPLASPPLSCAEAELAPTTQALSGLGLNPAGLAGLALGGDARTDALVNA